MNELIVSIAKWMLIAEVILVVLFVLTNYTIRTYHYFLLKEKKPIEDKIKELFSRYMKSNEMISKNDLHFFQKNILDVLKVYERYSVQKEDSESWEKLKNEIVMTLFYPRAKVLYRSSRDYKRYYAARCYYAHFEESDLPIVTKLIEDPVLLVSLNASRVAFKYNSVKLINTSIDVFSRYRKLRQSIYATIAHEGTEKTEKIIIDRIVTEPDPYIKGFCYRLLQQLPATESFEDRLNLDLNDKVLDLRIAALHYSGYNPKCRHLLGKYVDDEHWQMRAIAAEWIGKSAYLEALPVLAKRLSDHEWWVRIRAAEALGKCGPEGVLYLEQMTADKDQYGYEAAMQVLDGIRDKERVIS